MGTIFTQQPQNVPVDIAPVRPKSKRPREEQHTPPIFQRKKKYASSEQMDLKLKLACDGKRQDEGGMDTNEIRASAMRNSSPEIIGRRALLYKICPKKVDVAPRRIKITYFSPDEFLKRYPYKGSVRLGEGTYGEVYACGEYAVKKSFGNDDGLDTDLIREMNFFASVYHQCIARPVAWSYSHRDHITYVAMPKGSDLKKAYMSGKISIEQIISDTLSAIAYLNKLGIAHCDIKPANMIFHENCAKIIDLGLARYATLFSNNIYYINGLAYTAPYRAPEYVEEVWNPISAETYALAKSYYDLIGHEYQFSNMYTFRASDKVGRANKQLTGQQKKYLDELFVAAQQMSDTRPSTYELYEQVTKSKGLNVIAHEGAVLDTPVVRFKDFCAENPSWNITPEMLRSVFLRLMISFPRESSSRTLFAGFHLINRTIGVVKHDEKRLDLLGAVCMYLATIIFESDMQQAYLHSIVKQYGGEKVSIMMVDIIVASDCIIAGLTPWDYASCAEDLPEMLDDMVKCDYDPFFTRKLLHAGSSKSISAGELIAKSNMGITNIHGEIMYVEKSEIMPSNIVPFKPMLSIVMDGDDGWRHLIDNHDSRKQDRAINLLPVEFHHISRLLYARDILHTLEFSDAVSIYAMLRENRPEFRSGVDKLFIKQPDWFKTETQLLLLKLHPFATERRSKRRNIIRKLDK